MKFPIYLSSLILLLGCATADTPNEENHISVPEDTIEVRKPADDNYSQGRVYISQVKRATVDGKPVLLVRGSLPEGCSRLLKADYDFASEDVIKLEMASWRPADMACTQVLVEFSYIYDDIDSEKLQNVSHVEYNDERKELE